MIEDELYKSFDYAETYRIAIKDTRLCFIASLGLDELWCKNDPMDPENETTILESVQLEGVTTHRAYHDQTWCGVDDEHAIWCKGAVEFYGLGREGHVDEFERVPTSIEFEKVYVNARELCGLDHDGALYCRGFLIDSPGSNDRVLYDDFVPRQQDYRFEMISLTSPTCGITLEGKLMCWGTLDPNKLARDSSDIEDARAPVELMPGKRFIWVERQCAITDKHELMCWGTDHITDGLFANNAYVDQARFQNAETLTTNIDALPRPVRVLPDEHFVYVTTREDTRCALTTKLEAICWGDNNRGQAGLCPVPERDLTGPYRVPDQRFKSIALGLGFGCGLTLQDEISCWGGINPLTAYETYREPFIVAW